VKIFELKKWPSSQNPVWFEISLYDLKNLKKAISVWEDFENILKTIKWTSSVELDLEDTPWEIVYKINRKKMQILWVDENSVYQLLKFYFEGVQIYEINKNLENMDFLLKIDNKKNPKLKDFEEIKILNKYWEYVFLKTFVEKKLKHSLSFVKRKDWKLTITVSSQLWKWGNVIEITKKFLEKIKNYKMPNWVFFEVAWENTKNKDLFKWLFLWFLISIFLIYLILMIQFDSYLKPLIILFTLLFIHIWVNLWLFAFESERSLAYIIWIIWLSGIVVNDAIILMDKILKLQYFYKKTKEKISLKKLLSLSWKDRLSPILLTTFTTSFWIIPLYFIDSFWKSLSITIIFWLFVGSLITIFVIPILFYEFEKNFKETFLPLLIWIIILIIFTIFLNFLFGILISFLFIFFKFYFKNKN
jgi:multidrug efflux pump subunit AcrB